MYPFLTLDDNTEIVHSEMRSDGTVKVYIEKPDAKDCFFIMLRVIYQIISGKIYLVFHKKK